MKKVLALVLAVMMLATVAFAANTKDPKRHIANITPSTTLEFTKSGLKDSGTLKADITGYTYIDKYKDLEVIYRDENGDKFSDNGKSFDDAIFRSITNTNYTIQRVRIDKGSKNLVKGVSINDAEEQIEVAMVDDLDNQTSKSFEVSFTLKGKAKFILRDSDEVNRFNDYCASSKVITNIAEGIGKRVTLPDVDVQIIGTVGYGKVEISLGDDNDEEIEDLLSMGVNKANDVVKFKNGGNVGDGKRVAGAYTADAILTEEYGDALLLEARVYAGDVLYFNCKNSPDRDIIGRLADSDADMDFYLFNTNTKYTTLNSNAKLYFNDAEEDDFIYQIKDKKLVPTGTWSEDDDCWVVKTRVLGQYVVSDVELKEFEASAADIAADNNPDTGANDVVGIATALAAVALVSAAAVSLKK